MPDYCCYSTPLHTLTCVHTRTCVHTHIACTSRVTNLNLFCAENLVSAWLWGAALWYRDLGMLGMPGLWTFSEQSCRHWVSMPQERSCMSESWRGGILQRLWNPDDSFIHSRCLAGTSRIRRFLLQSDWLSLSMPPILPLENGNTYYLMLSINVFDLFFLYKSSQVSCYADLRGDMSLGLLSSVRYVKDCGVLWIRTDYIFLLWEAKPSWGKKGEVTVKWWLGWSWQEVGLW